MLLIAELTRVLRQPTRGDAIPIHLQVLASLNFLSGGSYQRKVGGDFLACMSQTSVSRFLHRVVDGLNILMRDWIKFPTTVQQIQRIQEGLVFQYYFSNWPLALALVIYKNKCYTSHIVTTMNKNVVTEK